MCYTLYENAFINNDNNTEQALERITKEKEYLEYINNHIFNVKKAYLMYFVPLLSKTSISRLVSDDELKNAIRETALKVKVHDASKFSDAEFDGYRMKYYTTTYEAVDEEFKELAEERFEECWKHHYTNNDHHPKYWVNPETGVPRDMSLPAIIEMICDWESMSIIENSNTVEWYNKFATKEKSEMSENTRKIVEDLLLNVLHGNSVEN
jgi:hypothetical protein